MDEENFQLICDEESQLIDSLYRSYSIINPIKYITSFTTYNYFQKDAASPKYSSTNIFYNTESEPKWQPVFIMIVSRVGIEKFNPIYIPHIQHLLQSKYSVGIIGGKPKRSLYFIGFQDDHLIYLDPHFVQATIKDRNLPSDFDSYRCKVPQRIPITSIDPSLGVGLYFRTKEDLSNFISDHKQFASKHHHTIFSIEEGSSFITPTESDFAFVKLVSAESFVGYHETGKIDAIVQIFNDAYRSQQ